MNTATAPTASNTGCSARPPMRDFEHSLPMALLRAREALMGCFRPLLSQHDITEQQWRIMRALCETSELEISELARRCCILLPSMSGILKRMQARDLVQRSVDAKDQRRSLISLTDAGRELISQVAPHSQARYAELELAIGKKRLQVLCAALSELEQALSTLNRK